MTVLTVTPNPALDLTYLVDHLRPGDSHRVRDVHVRPGGKGLNVARILTTLRVPARVVGPVGGSTGAQLRARARELGLLDSLVTVDAETRRTVAVVSREDGMATLFNERGPELGQAGWARVCRQVTRDLATADVVTVCGSVPADVAPEALAELVRRAAETVPVVVDTSGPALMQAALAHPAVLKPNADELREATGIDDLDDAAARLAERSQGAVVVSCGIAGLRAVTKQGRWSARLPWPLTGNPTGAGDSVVAALAMGLRTGRDWPYMLRTACALSAATVLADVAGEFDADAYAELLPAVEITENPP